MTLFLSNSVVRFFGIVTMACLLAIVPSMLLSQQPIGPYGTISWNTITALPTATATLTARQMVGIGSSIIVNASTYTTPTATALCALWPFVGSSNAASFNWDWYVVNLGADADAITVSGGSGVTVTGTATVAQNAIKHFKVNISGCGGTPAAVVYSLGSSVF